MTDETTVFSEAWGIIRDFYAPTMSAPEATKQVIKVLQDNGHEVYQMEPRWFMADGELYEIKKHRGWSHFELWQRTGC